MITGTKLRENKHVILWGEAGLPGLVFEDRIRMRSMTRPS